MPGEVALIVRPATAADVPAFVELLAEVAQEGTVATEPGFDRAAREAAVRELIENDGPETSFVLEHGGAVVGAIGVHATPVPGVLTVGMMITRRHRGRGGGRALLRAAIEHARAAGAHKVELEVWPDNEAAIGLYEAEGFELEGVRRDHYRRRDGSLRSARLMSLLL
jgi:putative acetyltransferase